MGKGEIIIDLDETMRVKEPRTSVSRQIQGEGRVKKPRTSISRQIQGDGTGERAENE
ncbi:hypothetical protein GWK91_01350 [Virgibacillus sp. MSP4-1]|uniref:hypothetical protein n=1 Tax=Virgibacillus sp. MSP4-1 TaxID=2700081 RepID=UPI000399DE39|nr:hypothetical protein [Virgibacillus sp. MSP4-1]QHS21679.1 hypothetical protein GWK91_01350 [Virgibacillus sp. MSP4-1]